ncbi:Putative ubiquitin carboxyl-terminal hydrolase FAF-Y [Heterocephalus glaber]|uniref:ubiquitinyl hydrolase 1 n=1 Tax=Heterocephalus glaber TaxID=10181 RepID=G5BII9_HETGA|nr:Putative ubiquitin carboxyl-terminal hydrolase FAF-Y [Heterocephalus glaber]
MTTTTRSSPLGESDSQDQAPDGQSQPPFQPNQTSSPDFSNENFPAPHPEQGQGDAPTQHEDEEEPAFPHNDLARLDDMINSPRGMVPVWPKGELEVLLEASVDLSKKGLDVKSEACQRFFRDGLTVSFTKILLDEAVSGWKFEIHRCIINNTHRLIELCVAKLSQDWFPLLELLAMALNPRCRFHIYNDMRPCELLSSSIHLPEDELFACSPNVRSPKGWLVDLINRFGTLNGFQILHDRFINGSGLNIQIIAALIKPFGQCYEFLSQHTLKKYFIPVIEIVPQLLEKLSDEELKNEAKSDALSMIIKSLKNLASKISGQEETIKTLEMFRLKMIRRLLQISSFNGKMNALNEINKVISTTSYYTHHNHNCEEEEWLTAERMAEWIQQNSILSIVLKDSLHHPQYVEKLVKILRFLIKERALTLQDLDHIWAAQAGKHEAIVKNVHDLLAQLAWDFSPEQLDHLFDCFKASWTNANKKQREKLLELICRLAEDNKGGVMVHKVLNLLWNLARSDDVPVDIMDVALSAHIKILDYRHSQAKQIWKCLAENAVYLSDREACFKWYSKLMGDGSDLDPDIIKDFFESNVLQLDPPLLTENGIKCFERFFKAVNCKEQKLIPKRRAYMMDDLQLIGLDYLWRVVIQSNDDVACRAIDLLKEIYTNLGPRLQTSQVVIHKDFIQSCFNRLRASYDSLCILDGDEDSINSTRQETIHMVRVLTVLREYINQCDNDFHQERIILPMSRAFRGKHVSLTVQFPSQGRQVDDMDILSHTNDTVGSVRRCILNRIKANVADTKIELFVGGELLDSEDDRKLIGQVNLKDKSLITAKLTQIKSNMHSSPDNSSTGSSRNHRNRYSDDNPEVESCLPGVIMSLHSKYISFLWEVADLGSSLNMPSLRDAARVLMKLMPPDSTTVEKLRTVCLNHSKLGESSLRPPLDSLFIGPSASQVLYLTEVVYVLLMPALAPLNDIFSDFLFHFLQSGGLSLVLNMLVRKNFLPNTDVETQRGAYFNALKIAKLLLTAVGYSHVRAVAEACQPAVDGADPLTPINQVTRDQAVVLQNALQSIPHPSSECMLRNISMYLAQQVSDEPSRYIPDICVIKAIQKIVWASGCGALELIFSPNEEITKIYEMMTSRSKEPEAEDEQICCEALEVMTLCFALIPTALDVLSEEKAWQTFVIDLLLHCPSKTVRHLAQEQFFLMCTRCCMGHRPLLFFITLLFTVLGSTARERGKYSGDYFTLLRHLLSYAYNSNINVPNADILLNNEIDWLKRIRDNVKNIGETFVEEPILEGHLGVTKELLAFQTPEKKYCVGCEKGGAYLVKELIDDFIFPASKAYLQYVRNGELPVTQAVPVCSSPATISAGFELLVALAIGCVRNLQQIVECLTELYYIGTTITTCEALTEWEYLPPVGPRPPKGFVGLKNAGATCYMNSVIQQLYMIPSIRNSILAIEGTGSDIDEDMFGDEKQDGESKVDSQDDVFGCHQFEDKPPLSKTEDRKEYNIGVLRHLQVIFGHLAASQLQYYVPRGFWKQFRLWNEPVNLLEEHDALEFFNSLVNSLDEALKALGHPPMISKVLGGSFADQKICQGCPHRYECEESFTTLNIDIRNHQNLVDSLEQYIKGDLLEGANAYHCEKCDKKVDAVKRLLIKKLPPVLAIQLKRFDYDWERECAIKFNDYFEFPRELDMEPYTVAGVAKLEGDNINPESQLTESNEESASEAPGNTKYRLVGVLVHSGQANEGHYYSYIIQRNGKDGERDCWYKFDDGDVTECKVDDDEEMKNQCFGGEYMREVFDPMMKCMSYRWQERLWNEPVNLLEEHDALEFFNSLVNSLDEALKALGHPPMISKVLGGSFADQKICQGCPHRYECEESFTTLNIDIRNHQNLVDSLEQYIKGDLLEGANAYHCEKCDKKVDAVKRLLIKKLPPVLAIQLKRFDYDWERECAIKFNDYFEFPRELDMEPYTVAGVAKLEGDNINPESQLTESNEESASEAPGNTKYRLVGVLVHSGQANEGHYYSYIIQRNGKDGERDCWYKFDDGDVTECKVDDDEEMKNQCFGGEYMREVFDPMMKCMSYRWQERWWNAYILFYERMDTVDEDDEIRYTSDLMSPAIGRSVCTQNVQFMHNQMHYSLEYFQFMKKLFTCNAIYLSPVPGQDHLLPEAEEIAMISIQLAARFLFTTGLHTKQIVRGPASDWCEALCILLRHSKNVRFWFAQNVLFNVSSRFSEYLLECPSAEVRDAFAKLIVFIAHFSLKDGSYPSPFTSSAPINQMGDNLSLSDHLLKAVLNLLRREVSEYGHHLQQYFNLFLMYANLGMSEKTQLLKMHIPAIFMLVSLDEGPGPPIKNQSAELGNLYSVVSQLIRCCSVSSRIQSSINGNPPLPNPFGDPNLSQPIMPIQQNVADILFGSSSYVKKVIEDCSDSEETIKLLQFCCWENPQFSSTVLSELLWQVKGK